MDQTQATNQTQATDQERVRLARVDGATRADVGRPHWWSQEGTGVRMEWGPAGAQRLVGADGFLVVVDVLSFTTAVSVAVERGVRVIPFRWRDERAAAYAAEHDAALAVGRRAVSPDSPWSLSPAALRRAPFTPRLVLPSPNGSAIASAAAEGGSGVVAACLRNAGAVATWLVRQGLGTPERPVVVIPAGERWPDGSLRPALEDLFGAGAVIDALARAGVGPLSAEAESARAVFATGAAANAVRACSSGRELASTGFADDVAIAVELDASGVVPVLVDGAFTDLAARSR
jgi:2-phosphosulfolactate phosphatase